MVTQTPQHVAIIMDGNGRWAKEKKLPIIAGHQQGANTAFEIAKEAYHMGVKWLTLYTFSTENWKRPKKWINDFFGVLDWYLDHELKRLIDNNIKLYVIGDYAKFPDEIVAKINEGIELTKNNSGLNLVLALNYGGRADIIHAVHKIIRNVKEGRVDLNDITESFLAQYLFTDKIPDPDLLIRTSGEYRISNFLIWQAAYAELAFCEKYWPDFTAEDFKNILNDYAKRERRYGDYTDEAN
jgi:undecaprenyl diphosphate synthase